MTDDTIAREALRKQERELIYERITLLRKKMDTVHETLSKIKSGEEVKTDPKVENENVLFMMPDVINAAKNIFEMGDIPFVTLLNIFDVWILRLELAATLNANHLKTHQGLMRHLEEALDSCRVIDHAVRVTFGF